MWDWFKTNFSEDQIADLKWERETRTSNKKSDLRYNADQIVWKGVDISTISDEDLRDLNDKAQKAAEEDGSFNINVYIWAFKTYVAELMDIKYQGLSNKKPKKNKMKGKKDKTSRERLIMIAENRLFDEEVGERNPMHVKLRN